MFWRELAAMICLSLMVGFVSSQVQCAESPQDNSQFIKDVTYTDGTKVQSGQELVKKWQIKNTGSVTWQNRYLVAVTSTAGPTDVKNIKRASVPLTKPGDICPLEATLKAPS